jgi:hypothetical protein
LIRPPFHCDYRFNIHRGAGVFLNVDGVILDVVAVPIGTRTQIGPTRRSFPPTPARRGGARCRASASATTHWSAAAAW